MLRKEHATSRAHKLTLPRSMPPPAGSSLAAAEAPAYGMPGDPAAIEAMILERAMARRRPSRTPGGGTHRDAALEALPVNASPPRAHSSGLPRPTIGVEAATRAGMDTAVTVQYITQLEHQLTALEAEHSRLCRVLLRATARNGVADCELEEAERRRDVTQTALASQQQLLAAVSAQFARIAVRLGLEHQLQPAAGKDDPRRQFAAAVDTLRTSQASLTELVHNAEHVSESLRTRDVSWRGEAAALGDAIASMRAELLRSLASSGEQSAAVTEGVLKEVRRGGASSVEAIEAAESGITLRMQAMLNSHSSLVTAPLEQLNAAVGHMHNDVRSNARDVQRTLSEEFHALTRRLEAAVAALDVRDAVKHALDAAHEQQQAASRSQAQQQPAAPPLGSLAHAARGFLDVCLKRSASHLDGLTALFGDAVSVKALDAARTFAAAVTLPASTLIPVRDASPAAGLPTTVAVAKAVMKVASAQTDPPPRTLAVGVATDDVLRRAVQVQTTPVVSITSPAALSGRTDDNRLQTFPSLSDEVTVSFSTYASRNVSDVFGIVPAATPSMEAAVTPNHGDTVTMPPTPCAGSVGLGPQVSPPSEEIRTKPAAELTKPPPAPTTGAKKSPVPSPSLGPKKASANAPRAALPRARASSPTTSSDDIDLSLDESDDDESHDIPPPLARTTTGAAPRTNSGPKPAGATAAHGANRTPPSTTLAAAKVAPKHSFDSSASSSNHGATRSGPPPPEAELMPTFQVTSTNELFAQLSINTSMPDMPMETSDLISPDNKSNTTSMRPPMGTGSPRGDSLEVIPSPFREAARMKRVSSFDTSPNTSFRSPRNRAVVFLDDGGGSATTNAARSQGARSRSPAASVSPHPFGGVFGTGGPSPGLRGNVLSPSPGPAAGGGGGHDKPLGGSASVVAHTTMGAASPSRDASPAVGNTATSTPSFTNTPAQSPPTLHLGAKKKGLPALGGFGPAKPAVTKMAMPAPASSGGGMLHLLPLPGPASVGLGAAGRAHSFDEFDE
jgi:hypothetical protein